MSRLRVAVVGAGPAGMYSVESLLERRGLSVEVDIYETLPTPWGLVRAGVAPDHPQKKMICDRQFDFLLRDDRVRLFANVQIGHDISVDDLGRWYNAVIYAVGANGDRRMGIPGENLNGCYAAREFVGFYNGHPELRDLRLDLSCERAVVIGNGNVALDVARILTRPVSELENTDISDVALQTLRSSRIREVVVLARRGCVHAAYHNPELEEFHQMAGIDVAVEGDELPTDDAVAQDITDWQTRLKLATLRRLTGHPPRPGHKRIAFRFLTSPVELLGHDRVEHIRAVRNRIEGDLHGFSHPVPTDETFLLSTGLVVTAIGYRGTPVPGLPFDDARGVVRNRQGRVLVGDERVVQGAYVSGWIKRGCRGVIGTNRKCARETVDRLFDDWASRRLRDTSTDKEAVSAIVRQRQPNVVSLEGWMAIDRAERNAGREHGRPRVKLTDRASLLGAVKNSGNDSSFEIRSDE